MCEIVLDGDVNRYSGERIMGRKFYPKCLVSLDLRKSPAAPAPKGKSFHFISQPGRGDQHSPEDEDDEHERGERVLGAGIDVGVLELLHE